MGKYVFQFYLSGLLSVSTAKKSPLIYAVAFLVEHVAFLMQGRFADNIMIPIVFYPL